MGVLRCAGPPDCAVSCCLVQLRSRVLGWGVHGHGEVCGGLEGALWGSAAAVPAAAIACSRALGRAEVCGPLKIQSCGVSCCRVAAAVACSGVLGWRVRGM